MNDLRPFDNIPKVIICSFGGLDFGFSKVIRLFLSILKLLLAEYGGNPRNEFIFTGEIEKNSLAYTLLHSENKMISLSIGERMPLFSPKMGKNLTPALSPSPIQKIKGMSSDFSQMQAFSLSELPSSPIENKPQNTRDLQIPEFELDKNEESKIGGFKNLNQLRQTSLEMNLNLERRMSFDLMENQIQELESSKFEGIGLELSYVLSFSIREKTFRSKTILLFFFC